MNSSSPTQLPHAPAVLAGKSWVILDVACSWQGESPAGDSSNGRVNPAPGADSEDGGRGLQAEPSNHGAGFSELRPV